VGTRSIKTKKFKQVLQGTKDKVPEGACKEICSKALFKPAKKKGGEKVMPKVVHIKDLNKFPFVDHFHVKLINLKLKTEKVLLTTKDIDLATSTAKNKNKCANHDKVIVTRETIIQMY